MYSLIDVIQTVVTTVATIIAAISVYALVRSNKRMTPSQADLKSLDLMVYFQNRYDKITWNLKSDVEKTSETESEEAAKLYYRRYWNLQLEQFQYWRLGLINVKIYSYWMECRVREYEENRMLNGVSYRDGFNLAMGYLNDTNFNNFVNMVFDGEKSVYRNGPSEEHLLADRSS